VLDFSRDLQGRTAELDRTIDTLFNAAKEGGLKKFSDLSSATG